MQRLRLCLISIACVVGAFASASVFAREFQVLLQPQRTDLRFHSHVAGGKSTFGLSSYSQQLAVNDCAFAMTAAPFRAFPATDKQALARSCEALSRSIVTDMPTNSLAWYVNALAFARLGDIQQFRVSYRQSRITAPNEQWIVEKRVQLAEEMFSELDAQALQDHEQDLTLLANSSRGTRSIARRYASDEHFRKRIVDIVSRLPPERQRAFLNNVRRAIR